MKKLVETIERTVRDTITRYEAIDGTVFATEEECKRYEETAEAVLLSKLRDIQINEFSCDDLFESSGEGIYRLVVPTTIEHIDTLNQLWKLNGGSGNLSDNLPFDKTSLNTIILVGIREYEGKIDWIWFWKFNEVIERITCNRYKITKNK